jgi:hypothetical protein
MFTPYGYNCHNDKEHVNDHEVDKDDVKNIVEFCVHFGVKLPEELKALMDAAKNKNDAHSAAHEAMDWMLRTYIDGTAGKEVVGLWEMTFGKKDTKVKAQEKLDWMRGTCKL